MPLKYCLTGALSSWQFSRIERDLQVFQQACPPPRMFSTKSLSGLSRGRDGNDEKYSYAKRTLTQEFELEGRSH